MPLWDFLQSQFKVVLKIMTIAKLFIIWANDSIASLVKLIHYHNSDNVVK